PAWLCDIVILGLDTGLRPGNLVGLRCAWVQAGGTCLIIPREHTKGKKLLITIPLTTRAADIVRQSLEHARSDYVFISRAGRPYTTAEINRWLQRAAVKAGLDNICLYTLRHSFISRLVQAGRPLTEVAALAGHREIKMTLRYAHLAPSHLRAGIQALERRSPGQPTAPTLSTEIRVTPVSQDFGRIA
ncbi:MAG TPA: site-specific integrase, partial [Nitrospiraceae bacterium]|nr:site-specific integrase [Nitrospiraceae bacterium]